VAAPDEATERSSAEAAPAAPPEGAAPITGVASHPDLPHVRHLQQGSRDLWLLGTAHVSAESVTEVRRAVELLQPDTVCVELCEPRYRALTDPTHWAQLDIFAVLRQGKALFLLANLALGAYQRRLGDRFGVKPGAELLAAAEAAHAADATLVLVDREIHQTLKRAWRSIPFFQRITLASSALASAFESGSDTEVSEEQIEALKSEAMASDVMSELAAALPTVKAALIDERDLYMVQKIREAPGDRVLAVVGAGHVPGMVRGFESEVDVRVDALEAIPPPGPIRRLVPWILPAIVLAAFWIGWQRTGGQSFDQLVFAWLLPNSIAAAVCTAIAGGRWLSVLTAFVASPITSLNPLLGAGMVTGLVEAWLRKPRVEDAERIAEDVTSWRGLRRNPFTRVLLVTLGATIGSALGAWIGATWVITLVNQAGA
jgi:pheromone shutdown-related protein TraB